MSYENTHISNEELDGIFKRAKKIFFVGIGGISMSSLAEYCVYLGKEVYGYDRERNEACKKLERVVKKIKYCSSPDSASHMDLVVYTGAIDKDNFEIRCAIKEGLPLVSRANFLGYIMSEYKSRIGVAGMHGKSTVTSLIAHIFEHADRNPTVFCGATMKEYLSPYKFGSREQFIFEACEYMDSFLNFSPTDAVILNIDYDHPDYFKSREQIISSFQSYAKKGERVFINADDEMSRNIRAKNIVTFGISSGPDYRAEIINAEFKDHFNEFSVYRKGKLLTRCKIRQSGEHMIYNALCALAVAYENGIPKDVIADAIYTFEGSERRLEYYKKSRRGGRIYIDYAHHPREIRATLSALRDMGYKNILCIYQAHTYSRTYALYEDFKKAFTNADRLIITDIYPARETNIYGITDRGFACDVGGEYISDFNKIANEVSKSDSDAIVIMGAGDIINLKKIL